MALARYGLGYPHDELLPAPRENPLADALAHWRTDPGPRTFIGISYEKALEALGDLRPEPAEVWTLATSAYAAQNREPHPPLGIFVSACHARSAAKAIHYDTTDSPSFGLGYRLPEGKALLITGTTATQWLGFYSHGTIVCTAPLGALPHLNQDGLLVFTGPTHDYLPGGCTLDVARPLVSFGRDRRKAILRRTTTLKPEDLERSPRITAYLHSIAEQFSPHIPLEERLVAATNLRLPVVESRLRWLHWEDGA